MGCSRKEKRGRKKHFKRTKGHKIRNGEEIRIEHTAKFQERGILRRAEVTEWLHLSKAKTSSKRNSLHLQEAKWTSKQSNEAVLQPSGREHSKNL